MYIKSNNTLKITSVLKTLTILLFFGLIPTNILAERWLIVDFGHNAASNTFGTKLPDWNQVLMHPEHTIYVNSDGDSEHDGLAQSPSAPRMDIPFFGIKGTTPFDFKVGHQVIATFHNRSDKVQLLMPRISFKDENEAYEATWDAPWNTMYTFEMLHSIKVGPGESVEMIFDITNEMGVSGYNAKPTEGYHSLINIGLHHDPYNQYKMGDIVLTKLELTDEADTTPPGKVQNLNAELITITPEAGKSAIRLTFDNAIDTNENGEPYGVDRYVIFRNGKCHHVIDKARWEDAYGDQMFFYDNIVAPNTLYEYEVYALDKSMNGIYYLEGVTGVTHNQRGNKGESVKVSISTPKWESETLINPFEDLTYLGAFRLPQVISNNDAESWNYAGEGLTFYPEGNPNYDSETHLPGSLFGLGHVYGEFISEMDIPKPIISKNIEDLPIANTIQPFMDPWKPLGMKYETRAGLGYNPGINGHAGQLFICMYQYYGADQLPRHACVDLDLNEVQGPWFIGGLPESEEFISTVLSGNHIFSVDQKWADEHLDGRSLFMGNSYVSGVGVPSHGPSIYAVNPWEKGSLPGSEGVIEATELLKYGGDFEEEKWEYNWIMGQSARGMDWISNNKQMAIGMVYNRSAGDHWYGAETGDDTRTDWDLPLTRGSGRGPNFSYEDNAFYFYNPMDLVRVAKGEMEPYAPQAYAVFDFPEVTYGNRGEGDMTFDKENGYLYFFENKGRNNVIHVWSIEMNPTNSGGSEEPEVSKFKLWQNYPNPFVSETEIDYSIPEESDITLTVYNTIGQVIKEIEVGKMKAGKHTIHLNNFTFAAGTYIYKLKAGKYCETKKMLHHNKK